MTMTALQRCPHDPKHTDPWKCNAYVTLDAPSFDPPMRHVHTASYRSTCTGCQHLAWAGASAYYGIGRMPSAQASCLVTSALVAIIVVAVFLMVR